MDYYSITRLLIICVLYGINNFATAQCRENLITVRGQSWYNILKSLSRLFELIGHLYFIISELARIDL